MQPLLLTLLLTLPLLLKAAITSFWDMTPITQDTLWCLAHAGSLEEAFVLTIFDQNQQKWQLSVDLPQLTKTSSKIHLVLSTTLLQGRLPPHLEAQKMAR